MTISRRHRAIAGMLLIALIYGSNFPITRYGIQHGLSSYDITALRFIGAGVPLLPLFLRAGWRNCAGIGWRRGLILTVMGGAPMSVLMITGLSFAPAAHGAAIAPGTVTLIGVIGSIVLFGARPTPRQIVGILVVLAGLGCIGLAGSTSGSRQVVIGDLMFLAVGMLWGGYPLLVQRWRINPLIGAVVVSVVSLLYLPLYFALAEVGLGNVPFGVVLFHAINQGVFNVMLGIGIWGWSAQVLGAAVVGRFPPLIPVIGTLLAIPILGEWPGKLQVAGVSLIVLGLLVVALRRMGRATPPAGAVNGLSTSAD